MLPPAPRSWLRQARRLRVSDLLMVAGATIALAFVEASLMVRGAGATAEMLQRIARWPWRRRSGGMEERHVVALAVNLRRAGRLLSQSRRDCLGRSLLLHAWLQAVGETSVVRLGVRQERDGLRGHAWVEWRGRPIGEPDDVEMAHTTFDDVGFGSGVFRQRDTA